MKRFFVVSTLVGVMGATTGAQSTDAVKNEVIAAQKRFYDAYKNCNHQETEMLIVDDPLYRHAAGTVQEGKAEFLKGMRPADDCNFDVLRVDPRSVRILGDTAIVFGDLTWKVKGSPVTEPGKNIAMTVFVKRNGRWLFAANASAEVPERRVAEKK